MENYGTQYETRRNYRTEGQVNRWTAPKLLHRTDIEKDAGAVWYHRFKSYGKWLVEMTSWNNLKLTCHLNAHRERENRG